MHFTLMVFYGLLLSSRAVDSNIVQVWSKMKKAYMLVFSSHTPKIFGYTQIGYVDLSLKPTWIKFMYKRLIFWVWVDILGVQLKEISHV